MEVRIAEDWKEKLNEEFNKDYFIELSRFVKKEYQEGPVFPPGKQLFAAYDQCRWEDLKVVIIGQDPYHGPGQANGLCFSVNKGVAIPPSLRNIYKEIEAEFGKVHASDGDLSSWARQGVLLLNATLTVRSGEAGSHQGKGWEDFTDNVIKLINKKQ